VDSLALSATNSSNIGIAENLKGVLAKKLLGKRAFFMRKHETVSAAF